MADETRPPWAQRLASERQARGWTQQKAVEMLRAKSRHELPADRNLLRMWKNWEAGKHRPRAEYQKLIADSLGTVSAAIFGPEAGTELVRPEPTLIVPTGDNTLELLERIRCSDLDRASLDSLTITVEQLCSEYAFMPSADLRREGQDWMRKVVRLLDCRVTLDQHRELLVLAAWLALLVGCVEYDMRDIRAAEATRQAAAGLGKEADHAGIMAWAQEMTCWFALTQGRYRQVIEAARAGYDLAPNNAVAVQLAGQEAKAWARMGDRREVELALDRGRRLLESLPYPSNIDNHFTFDPDKFDFYAMDCYRHIGEDPMARMHAKEVIRKSTRPDGSFRSPMRASEAFTTLAVASARDGDLDGAIETGSAALDIPRQSVPSLLFVTGDLVTELRTRYDHEPAAVDYFERIDAISGSSR
jgi:transcriptional regulator with XRE-family HTH domain